jgi:hypothetical protein
MKLFALMSVALMWITVGLVDSNACYAEVVAQARGHVTPDAIHVSIPVFIGAIIGTITSTYAIARAVTKKEDKVDGLERKVDKLCAMLQEHTNE